ncbi:MAG: energy transducer TonB [Rhodocyclaceae bacterium]|nr:energy transducer TonB [Rhodocyclaceae bacterium]
MSTQQLQHAVPPGLTFPATHRTHAAPVAQRLAFVLALHALVFWLLLRANVITLPAQLSVLSVSLLRPAEETKPQPEVTPPRPKPVKPRPVPQQPPVQLAAPETSPAPSPVAVPSEPAPPVAAPPAPVQATQPRFDADYLDNPKPPYHRSRAAWASRAASSCAYNVAPDGATGEVLLHTSSGSPRLDESALQTVRRWKFVPAGRGTRPVAAWVLVPIAFTLKE